MRPVPTSALISVRSQSEQMQLDPKNQSRGPKCNQTTEPSVIDVILSPIGDVGS